MKPDPIELADWETVDDVVMGGISRSRLKWAENALRFEGDVSLENNGGFCSARNHGLWDLSGATHLIWSLRGSSRHFQATLRTANIPENASFRHTFQPQSDWQDVEFRLDDFRLFRRGEQLSEDQRPDLTQVVSFGVLLADKTPGPFWLELARIGYR